MNWGYWDGVNIFCTWNRWEFWGPWWPFKRYVLIPGTCEFYFFFQKWMFKDRIKLRILSWGDHRVLFSGVLNPMRCICVRVRQGYFTVLGRNFEQQNHHEKTQRCEKKCGTELTMRKTVVYESSEKRVKLRFIWPPLGSACQEGQNFCWILYGWKWPQNA